jgi:hypothetical protein
MNYECAFDFTICKPKTSQFIGKNGVIELTTETPFTNSEIENLKSDETFLNSIAYHLNTVMKQKNIFMIKVKSITQS